MLQLIDMHGSCEYFHISHRSLCSLCANAMCHCSAAFGHDELDLLQYFFHEWQTDVEKNDVFQRNSFLEMHEI